MEQEPPDAPKAWGPLRRWGHIFLHGRTDNGTSHFDTFIGIIVLFNVAIMIVETDAGAGCPGPPDSCTPPWVVVTNYIMLSIYTAEAARLCAGVASSGLIGLPESVARG